MATIPSNLQNVRERIASAAGRAGRQPEEIELVAVTKGRLAADVRDLIAAGQHIFGESRVQEALEKFDVFEREVFNPPLEWHFIGHLQTNKAKMLAGRAALIHGVDSLRLAESLQRAAEQKDCAINLLLEVNVSGEAAKFGIAPEDLDGVIAGLRPLDRLRCLGLMTMAPWEARPEETRPVFRGLREMLERLKEAGHEHVDARHLSMGMTNDFEVAVEEGATLVRIGTALFE